MDLHVDGQSVATYVTRPVVDPQRGPRPYLHPVRTRAGTVVTDVLPEDHPHHLGVSVALQDVNRVNLWGGKTYVRGTGYTWLEDHAVIEHVDFGDTAPERIEARLRWCDPAGQTLLTEDRVMAARPHGDDAWWLDFSYTLTNPTGAPVRLGSPGTNGRPDNAGYGGLFWRAAPGQPTVCSAESTVESELTGSVTDWVALVGADYTLVFTGLGDGDRWFVRAKEYPGVCAAIAFDAVRELAPGDRLSRHHRVLVADGTWGVERCAAEVANPGN
jgi:hypothetical protein